MCVRLEGGLLVSLWYSHTAAALEGRGRKSENRYEIGNGENNGLCYCRKLMYGVMSPPFGNAF